MYTYSFTLTPSRVKSDIIFTDYKDILAEAVENINSGIAFGRDGKSISIDDSKIKEKSFEVVLESVSPLENPARSLSSLTRYLTTKYPEKFKDYLYNKKLFNFKLVSKSEINRTKNERITNEELLKGIIDLFYAQKRTKERQKAIDEIKKIVVPFMK
ncbi:MAG: hypothetical protein K5654_09670 [Lachnospiraceae bacterium]|nr:hypothetical protein [Lachnospiraceae bacterium]